MSSGPNHRRGHGRVQERGPRFEDPNPAKGCNSTHVARGRKKHRTRRRRKERRLSVEEVHQLLKEGTQDARELDARLRRVFLEPPALSRPERLSGIHIPQSRLGGA